MKFEYDFKFKLEKKKRHKKQNKIFCAKQKQNCRKNTLPHLWQG